MRSSDLEVEIGELVLHGITVTSREGIAEAIRSELATMLADWNPAVHEDMPQLDGGSFALPASASADAVGRSVARQIERSLRMGYSAPEGVQMDATSPKPLHGPPTPREGTR